MTDKEIEEFADKLNKLDNKDFECIFYILKGMLMSRKATNVAKSKKE